MAEERNGWGEYQRLVMAELKKLDTRATRIEDAVNRLHVDLSVLRIKASLGGLLAGAVPSGLAVIWIIVNK